MTDVDLGPTAADWAGRIAEGPYPAAVKRLKVQNDDLTMELQRVEAARKREVKALRAQLREGLSPELLVLRREIRQWRERALAAEGRFREAVKRGEAAT